MSAAAEPRDSAGVKVPPPLIFLSCLLAGLALDAVLDGGPVPGLLRWGLGATLTLCGLALLASFMGAFRRAGTAVEPWKPTTAIVTTGLYGRTRNPAYLGMALVIAGIALLADAPWALLAVPVAMAIVDRAVIAREERYLERTFGEEYLAYKRSVRRWI